MVGDAGLFAAAGAAELATSFAFKRGSFGRTGLQVAAASHFGDALADVLAGLMQPGGGE